MKRAVSENARSLGLLKRRLGVTLLVLELVSIKLIAKLPLAFRPLNPRFGAGLGTTLRPSGYAWRSHAKSVRPKQCVFGVGARFRCNRSCNVLRHFC